MGCVDSLVYCLLSQLQQYSQARNVQSLCLYGDPAYPYHRPFHFHTHEKSLAKHKKVKYSIDGLQPTLFLLDIEESTACSNWTSSLA